MKSPFSLRAAVSTAARCCACFFSLYIFFFICLAPTEELTGETCYIGPRTSYVGKVSVTESGKTCQPWKDQYPHAHSYGDKTSDFSEGEFPDNFCRTTLDYPSATPWCYTSDPDTKWEYCDVRACGRQCMGQLLDHRSEVMS